jgi:hypothetical protein
MKVAQTEITQLVLTELKSLDPVKVMIENISPGAGNITISCFGKSWTSYWGSMSGMTIQDFFLSCNNPYLINCLDRGISSTIDGEDNEANINFVKDMICKLRRENEITEFEAREYWREAEDSDDVKFLCCNWTANSSLRNIMGDEPWYCGWPSVPNPDYEYLKRIVQAVREALEEIREAV